MNAMSARKVKVEDLRRFVFISDPQISPDGDRVAFVHTKIDYSKDSYVKHIWMWARESGKTEQFTHGSGNDSYPRWSPDGRKLLFLSSKRQPEKEKPQLWVIPSSGGEAHLFADVEEGISAPEWAPDSRRILFLSRVWEDEKPKTDVRVISRIVYKQNGVGIFAGHRAHLFVVQGKGNPRQLTEGPFDIDVATWSTDGKKIAFVTNMDEDADISLVRDIYITPSSGGEPQKLTQGKHVIRYVSCSPDGEKIAFIGHDKPERAVTNLDVWIMPLGGREARNLTLDFDRSLDRSVGSDLRVSTPNPGGVWSPTSDTIYFMTGTVPTTNIYRIDRRTARIEQLSSGRNIEGFSLSADGEVMAYTAIDATNPAELWVKDGVGEKQVTRFNERLLRRLKLSEPEHYTFKNELDAGIDAWIIKPPDFEPGKKYSAVLEIHGGPRSIYGSTMFLEFQLLAAEGHVVLYTNPRGSGGYGEEYAAVLEGRWGEVDYDDLMTFMDDALERFDFIDPERLGVTGGSYGGFLTNWIVTHTDRFRAAVTCRSTCNRFTHHGTSDLGFRHGTSGNMGFPWKDEEKLMRQSPIRYAANAKTPTLIIHSENDLRCPMPGAEEFFVALKEVGVDTELVRFPDETHELSRSGKPKHREERLRHMLRWFDKYLKSA